MPTGSFIARLTEFSTYDKWQVLGLLRGRKSVTSSLVALSFVDQLKSQWIMEDIYLPSEIIQKVDKMHGG